RIEDGLAGLRPGMTAQVKILIDERDDVFSVPLAAVVHYDGKDHLAVKKPDDSLEWREVTLGISDDKVVEVKQGIKAGERVALNPLDLISEEEQRQKLNAPTKPAEPSPGSTPRTPTKGVGKARTRR